MKTRYFVMASAFTVLFSACDQGLDGGSIDEAALEQAAPDGAEAAELILNAEHEPDIWRGLDEESALDLEDANGRDYSDDGTIDDLVAVPDTQKHCIRTWSWKDSSHVFVGVNNSCNSVVTVKIRWGLATDTGCLALGPHSTIYSSRSHKNRPDPYFQSADHC